MRGRQPAVIAAEARWLRKELAAIKDGGGSGDLARRTIAELTTATAKRKTEE